MSQPWGKRRVVETETVGAPDRGQKGATGAEADSPPANSTAIYLDPRLVPGDTKASKIWNALNSAEAALARDSPEEAAMVGCLAAAIYRGDFESLSGNWRTRHKNQIRDLYIEKLWRLSPPAERSAKQVEGYLKTLALVTDGKSAIAVGKKIGPFLREDHEKSVGLRVGSMGDSRQYAMRETGLLMLQVTCGKIPTASYIERIIRKRIKSREEFAAETCATSSR